MQDLNYAGVKNLAIEMMGQAVRDLKSGDESGKTVKRLRFNERSKKRVLSMARNKITGLKSSWVNS
jgi:hypothetical protein